MPANDEQRDFVKHGGRGLRTGKCRYRMSRGERELFKFSVPGERQLRPPAVVCGSTPEDDTICDRHEAMLEEIIRDGD